MSKVNKFGFKVGDRFESFKDVRCEGLTWVKGSIVRLSVDDGSDCPEFELLEGKLSEGEHKFEDGCSFEFYDHLKKID